MSVLISIITPNYNKAQYIKDCIQSVLAQSYPHWEMLIIDDGSSDSSCTIVEQIKQKDSRIQLFHNPSVTKGGSAARNLGINKAQGDYIIFLDSDDVLAPFCLEHRLKFITGHPDVDWSVHPIATFMDNFNEPLDIWFQTSSLEKALDYFLAHDILWTISSTIWKASSLKKLKGFNPNYPRYQDVELHSRALMQKDFHFIYDTQNLPDMGYRIDPLRSDLMSYSYCEKNVLACKLYIQDFRSALITSSQKEKVKYLKSTLLATYNTLLYAFQSKNINLKELYTLISSLEISSQELLGPLDRLLMQIYLKLKMQQVNIKGLNFLLKKWLLIK